MALALVLHVGMPHAVRGQRVADRERLRRRDDRVIRPLQDQHRRAQPVPVRERRSVDVQVLGLGQRADEAIEVARLEVVRVRGEGTEVGDAVPADPGGEDIRVRQGAQHRPAARGPALDREAPAIGRASLGESPHGGGDVLHVDDAPLPVEALAVAAPVPGRSAVVHIEHADPAAREVRDGGGRVARHVRRRPAVHQHEVGRQLVRGRGHRRVRRGIVEGVHVSRRPWEGDRAGTRKPLGVEPRSAPQGDEGCRVVDIHQPQSAGRARARPRSAAPVCPARRAAASSPRAGCRACASRWARSPRARPGRSCGRRRSAHPGGAGTSAVRGSTGGRRCRRSRWRRVPHPWASAPRDAPGAGSTGRSGRR